MSATVTLSLLEQRLALRRQMSEQREVIALQLTPARLDADRLVSGSQLRQSAFGRNSVYPRSLTMRWLTQNPAPLIKLATSAATWLLGARYSGILKDGMQFLKMVRAGATLR